MVYNVQRLRNISEGSIVLPLFRYVCFANLKMATLWFRCAKGGKNSDFLINLNHVKIPQRTHKRALVLIGVWGVVRSQ